MLPSLGPRSRLLKMHVSSNVMLSGFSYQISIITGEILVLFSTDCIGNTLTGTNRTCLPWLLYVLE